MNDKPNLMPESRKKSEQEGVLEATQAIANLFLAIKAEAYAERSWARVVDLVEQGRVVLERALTDGPTPPIPMALYCPAGHRHLDLGEWATRPHRTHQCQAVVYEGGPDGRGEYVCGLEWRPANFPTVGVEKLP